MKNLVFIETYNRHGSGIIFPCRAKEENSYIVITNYHVIRDLNETSLNIRDCVNLEFYDNRGRKIDIRYIKSIEIAYGEVFDNENDIAALLVVLDEAVHIEFEDYVCFEILQEAQVFTEGYPEVLNDSDVNRRLCLEGKRESTFPIMDKMGIYKLTDSIHWYKEYTDKELLDGLSGGPVYAQKRDINYLLGINQSLCNVGDGNNPFKIVYYIQIRQVFEWLREQGILLFEYNNGKIQIEWIYHREKKDQDITILLLGGSGAGKSSFVKEFLLHGREVNASGDGQTTRMDIYYQLSDYCEEPIVNIKVLSRDDFSRKLIKQTHLNIIEYLFTNLFELPYVDLSMNMLGYVKIMLPQLECLLKILRERKHNSQITEEEKREKILENMKEIICKDDETEQREIEILYDDILKMLASLSREEQITERQLSGILRREDFLQYCEKMKWEGGAASGNQELLKDYICNILERKIGRETEKRPYKIDVFDVGNVCRGFFDIREFYYLKKSFENEIKQMYGEFSDAIKGRYHFYKEKTNEDELELEDDKPEDKPLRDYYERLYDKIISAIREYHFIDLDTQKNWKIQLDDMGKRERVFLELCLKVVKGRSLSGIVEKIKIEDSISNNYACMLKQKGIGKLCFIDTCGLDHIERGIGIKSHLNQIFTEYKDNKIVFDSIFYIKKLDSGRPTELERILPLLYNACPGKPVFCIFTGADIFYAGREELLVEREWCRYSYEQSKRIDENVIPKSAAYFYENQSIVSKMPCSEAWKGIIYHVVTENLIPFVADTRIRNKTEYIISNRRYLKKLFEAILLDEWNAGYIDIEKIDKLMENPEFIDALKEDICRMFYKASLADWNYKHHMTVNANVTRLLGKNSENSMGYNGVSMDRWDCLLKTGYQEVFLEGNSKAVKMLSDHQIGSSQSESMFAKLKDNIIAMDTRFRIADKERKSEFRKSFEQMYDKESGHKYNPFSEEGKYIKLNNQIEKREYLADVCDFTKGLERENIREPFVEIFRKEIRSYIKEQNKNRMKLLLQYRSDFKQKIYSVIDEIEEIVGKDNNEWILEMIQEIIKLREKL
jgi:hypothetical protein